MEDLIWGEAIKALEHFGFPAIVAFWLLYRTDKRLDKILDLLVTIAGKGRSHREDK